MEISNGVTIQNGAVFGDMIYNNINGLVVSTPPYGYSSYQIAYTTLNPTLFTVTNPTNGGLLYTSTNATLPINISM